MQYDDIILEKRSKKSYSKDVYKALKLISIDPENPVIFGSASYKMQSYPGDVDASEIVPIKLNKNESIKYFENKIKNVVKRIFNLEGYYITEIKTGLDKVFEVLDIGKLDKGKIIYYNRDDSIVKITNLYKNKFLTGREYNDFMKLLKPYVTVEELEELLIMERNKVILRWSAEEFIRGFKQLLPNRIITLNDALHDKTMVKIDMLAPINNKYIEVTNFFVLEYEYKGEKHFVNLEDNHFTDIINNLKKEVNKLYYNSHFYNPLKLAKRMWSMARLSKDMKMINKLTPLLRSDAGLLAQLNSELETIILIYENVNVLPIYILRSQLDNMKTRLSNVIDIEMNTDDLINVIDNINSSNNRNYIIELLKKIKKYIKDKMIGFSEKYLKSVKLLPPPKNYL